MSNISNLNLNYSRPIKVAEGVYWIGFYDTASGLHCNPYMIVDGEEAVVIDGGSRPDFPTVMMKIMQTGVIPSTIRALIYQHYDPDLCGSIPDFEDLIDRNDLKIISEKSNHAFIRHYYVSSELLSLDTMDNRFRFSSGRELLFIKTPYAHSSGSFVTFDPSSGILFTSDLFGSFSLEWQLFLQFEKECASCEDYAHCPNNKTYCPMTDILNFHKKLIPSTKILRWAIEQIAQVPFSMIAPQHGSIIHRPEDVVLLCQKLALLEDVGIDGIALENPSCIFDSIALLKERLGII